MGFLFIIAVLAVGAIVEFIRHSELISEQRIKWATTPNFSSRLLRCPYCTSHWAAGFVVLVLVGPVLVFGYGWPGYWIAMILAVTRAANLLNDVTHAKSRSPKRNDGTVEL